MRNNLMIFEGNEIEILTKEDVNFDFNGEVLFNGKQVHKLLGYSEDNYSRYINNYCDEDCVELITKDKLSSNFEVSLGQRGTKFITEDGVIDLIYNSKMPKAKEFKKKVREIVKKVQQTGKYDSIEQQIMLIEDEKERTLSIELYKLNELLKINPNDMFNILQVKNKEQELALYKQSLQLEDIKNEVKDIKQVTEGIKKATVLREGDSNAYVVADRFGIYSTNNKAHNQFASKMAKILGIYVNPEGNGGYQDEYVSVNLTNYGGKTTATLMYSEKAIDKMREYISENGLLIKPVYYIKGDKKGQFKEAILYLDGEDSYIKVNETTYNKYLDK